ncbi:MAG: hypothetical protein ACOC53_01030 [Candidatus Saliniplasma sp.]
MDIYQFLTVLLITLGLGLLLAGLFTAYFGRGKSRMVGVVLAILGILFGAMAYVLHMMEMAGFGTTDVFVDTIIIAIKYVGAFLIGAAIALVIFLAAIMKT